MFKFIKKVSFAITGLVLTSAAISAQEVNQYVEVKLIPEKGAEKVVTRLDGQKAANFDLTAYINQNISKGDIIINGLISSDIEYTRIKFDSRKIEDAANASFCQTMSSQTKPFIGIASSGMDDFSGVLLERVIDGSAANQASLEAGDVISYINDKEIRSVCDLKIAVSKLEIGEQIQVTYDGHMDNQKQEVIVGSREQHLITWKTCAVATATVDVNQNITTLQNTAAFEVFPNPSNGVSTLTFENASKGALNIKIYDLQGRLILEQDKLDFEGYYEEEINISGQPSGIYLVEMSLNGEKFTKELVVANQ